MKNKLWKQWMLSGVLVSAMVVSCGVSVSVQAEETTETEEAAETDSSAESEDDLRILFDQAVEDAMIAEDGEILPVVSLDEGEPYAVYNEEGRVLLYTFHKYPDSYPDGTDVKLEWGNVWTFTGGELEDWYQENKEGVTDWQTRMKELLGLTFLNIFSRRVFEQCIYVFFRVVLAIPINISIARIIIIIIPIMIIFIIPMF